MDKACCLKCLPFYYNVWFKIILQTIEKYSSSKSFRRKIEVWFFKIPISKIKAKLTNCSKITEFFDLRLRLKKQSKFNSFVISRTLTILKNVAFILGCKLNFSDNVYDQQTIRRKGILDADFSREIPDCSLLNTCSVTEKRTRSVKRSSKKRRSRQLLLVTIIRLLSQLSSGISEMEGLDAVLGAARKLNGLS